MRTSIQKKYQYIIKVAWPVSRKTSEGGARLNDVAGQVKKSFFCAEGEFKRF